MARYVSLSCELPGDLEEGLASVLSEFDVLGSEIQPSTTGSATATIYLEQSKSEILDRLCRSLSRLGVGSISTGIVEDRDWLEAYRQQARPFAIGRLWWIDPQPSGHVCVPAGRIRLGIEPSSAFGSGSHESTQLVLMLLERMDVRGCHVLDVGTGCGILAYAACALSAQTVVALDIDPEAVWVARRMAASRDVPRAPQLLAAPVQSLGSVQFDIILCNMISSELLPLLPELRRLLAPTGRMVLSGVLCSEGQEVGAAMRIARFRVVGEQRLGEWMAFEVGRV